MTKFALAITLLGGILSFAGPSLSDRLPSGVGIAVVIIGLLMTSVAAISQYRSARPFVADFAEADWTQATDGYRLVYSRARHRLIRITSIAVLIPNASGHEEVMCDKRVESDGSVALGASRPFAGRVVVA